MKTLLVTLSVALAGVSAANAQMYRPSVVGQTAVLGAVAGALVGGHNNDRWAEGALIGAATGAVVGAVIDQSRPARYYSNGIAPVAFVPNAPLITDAAPPVVYVANPAPVVYVDPYPPVVVTRPIVHFSSGWGHGYRYHGWGGHHRYANPWPRAHRWHSRNHYVKPHHPRSDHGHGRDWRGDGRRGHDRHDGRRYRR